MYLGINKIGVPMHMHAYTPTPHIRVCLAVVSANTNKIYERCQ